MNKFISSLMPESIRWLIVKGRKQEARDTIDKISNWNFMSHGYTDLDIDNDIDEAVQESDTTVKASFSLLFSTRKGVITTLKLIPIW